MTDNKDLMDIKAPRFKLTKHGAASYNILSDVGKRGMIMAPSNGKGIFRAASLNGPIYIDGEFGERIIHPLNDSIIVGSIINGWIDFENAWSELKGKPITWSIVNDDDGHQIMYIKQVGTSSINHKGKIKSKLKARKVAKCSCKKK